MTEDRHQQRQQRLKEKVDARIDAANEIRGTLIIFTGNGKGKTTAAFGTVTRALGHGLQAGVIQFIKGEWPNGEKNLLQQHGVEFKVMATGLPGRRKTKRRIPRPVKPYGNTHCACWPILHWGLVVLDELTYMLSYGYLALEDVIQALQIRPHQQTIIITGRGCHRDLLALADTVSEMRPIKHAFDAGIQAQQGIDW